MVSGRVSVAHLMSIGRPGRDLPTPWPEAGGGSDLQGVSKALALRSAHRGSGRVREVCQGSGPANRSSRVPASPQGKAPRAYAYGSLETLASQAIRSLFIPLGSRAQHRPYSPPHSPTEWRPSSWNSYATFLRSTLSKDREAEGFGCAGAFGLSRTSTGRCDGLGACSSAG